MKRLINLCIGLTLSMCAMAQGYRTLDEQSVTLKQPADVLAVLNINGPVRITGSDRNDVLVKYKLEAKPETSRGWDHAQNELRMEIKELADSIVIALDAPFVNYYRGNRHINIDSESMDYWFKCSIVVEVPKGINLHAGTINDGDIEITGITGTIVADNINGDLNLNSVDGRVVAETINGDISINFTDNPGDGSHFQTINGHIKTKVPEDLSANVAFKSMNGEFYTDFEYRMGENGVVVKDHDDHHGTHFRIEQSTRVKIGSGHSSLSYETLNGNMYLRKLN